MIPFLTSRSSQLTQEFGFFPTAPPHDKGGIFELRSYQLKPGTLLEWENTWFVLALFWMIHELTYRGCWPRRIGTEARRKFITPVGAWFSQVGRLHEVHHMWQYPYVLSPGLSVVLLTFAYEGAWKVGKRCVRQHGS
jgi:hypothetical protein